MASKNKNGKAATTDGNGASMAPALPDGFRNLVPERVAAYFTPSEGATLRGVLLGRHERRDEEGFYYQIRTTEPCDSVKVQDSDDEWIPGEAAIGVVVNVDERSQMTGLATYDAGTVEVFIRCLEKVKIKGGKHTMWVCQVAAREMTSVEIRQMAKELAEMEVAAAVGYEQGPARDPGAEG